MLDLQAYQLFIVRIVHDVAYYVSSLSTTFNIDVSMPKDNEVSMPLCPGLCVESDSLD